MTISVLKHHVSVLIRRKKFSVASAEPGGHISFSTESNEATFDFGGIAFAAQETRQEQENILQAANAVFFF